MHKLFNMDCFELLPQIPSNSIDLILTDPPYNINQYSTGDLEFDNRADINTGIAEWDAVPLDIEKLCKEFRRILKPKGNVFCFCAPNQFGEYHRVLDPAFDTFQFMVWHKSNPVPCMRKSTFLNSCELIVCAWDKGHTWNFTTQKEMHNYIESPICMGKERLSNPHHPTQKPVKVLEKIVSIASNPGDLVFDPFMGVGSVGDASIKLGRKFLGCELDESYYNASVERLDRKQV